MSWLTHVARACVCVALVSPVAGCGSGDPFDYVHVSGKVTYDDGSLIPAERITVTFVPQGEPQDRKLQPRPGVAEVNVADGTFDVVTSHKYGDGVVPGRHKVWIVALDAQSQRLPLLPPEYQSAGTTPLEVDTADGPFEWKIPKP